MGGEGTEAHSDPQISPAIPHKGGDLHLQGRGSEVGATREYKGLA